MPTPTEQEFWDKEIERNKKHISSYELAILFHLRSISEGIQHINHKLDKVLTDNLTNKEIKAGISPITDKINKLAT